ncbi:MAG: Na/Pi cotransporter family protein [Firmicutes bacterium]|nr:Na/Pi cotransporter family protein [Bacillota bacterium]
MAIFYHVIALLGGLAMFLYGMRVMGDGLKANSGGTLKVVLSKVTDKPILAFLLGVLVTCIIQSSTATIVLSVGLVGAGLLTFQQSIGIVLGANVGTAITAQIIRLMDLKSAQDSLIYFFKADNLAPMALIIGIVILMTTKRESRKNIGNVACGFGILFMGLIFMSDAVAVFEDSLSKLLTAFENNYLLGFGAGVLVTGIIQSSSAVVGIIQSVASTVGVTFKGVFAVIIGVNIGDCLTTFLVSRIGARPEQIRTVVVHVLYNICAAILIVAVLTIGRSTSLISDGIWFMKLNSGGVANLHGLLRMIPAVCLLPFTNLFAKVAMKIVPDEPAEENEDGLVLNNLVALDEHLLSSPILAMDRVSHLLRDMADISYKNYKSCTEQVFGYVQEKDKKIKSREDLLDRITDQTNQYLIKMTPYIKRGTDFQTQNFALKSSSAFERIGDLSYDILNVVRDMNKQDIKFSDTANKELTVLIGAVNDILTMTIEVYRTKDMYQASKIEPLEEVIDELAKELNNRHTKRLSQNNCGVVEGLFFQNIVLLLESISDKCSDICVYVTELVQPDIRGREHEYIHSLHHSNDAQFRIEYKNNMIRYYGELDKI